MPTGRKLRRLANLFQSGKKKAALSREKATALSREKAFRRVVVGLERQTAKLRPNDVVMKAAPAMIRVQVKYALDDVGVRDRAKRQRIHALMKTISHRAYSLKSFGKRGEDRFLVGLKKELSEELGGRKNYELFKSSFLQTAKLIEKLSEEN